MARLEIIIDISRAVLTDVLGGRHGVNPIREKYSDLVWKHHFVLWYQSLD